jgi:enoyl-CoA hydratase
MVRLEMRPDIAAGVAVMTIDRPERRNAVDLPTLEEILHHQRAIASSVDSHDPAVSDAAVRVLILTGSPPAFCAGADLTGVEEGEFTATLTAVLRGFTQLRLPVIAAVDGPALGAGTQLAMVCDLRVATESSRFGIPAARLGLVVDHWTVDRLTREFGFSTARAMLLAAETFDGVTLNASGAVHRTGGLDVALEWAREIASLAPLTIAGHKLALESSHPGPEVDVVVEQARRTAWASSDAQEGRTAFLEKRVPRFTGR